jgi:hypothetical protein
MPVLQLVHGLDWHPDGEHAARRPAWNETSIRAIIRPWCGLLDLVSGS